MMASTHVIPPVAAQQSSHYPAQQGNVLVMWGTVFLLALAAATDPIRLGIATVLITLPRPIVNLLAFWLGGMASGVASALGALILLRDFLPKVMQDVTSTVAIFS